MAFKDVVTSIWKEAYEENEFDTMDLERQYNEMINFWRNSVKTELDRIPDDDKEAAKKWLNRFICTTKKDNILSLVMGGSQPYSNDVDVSLLKKCSKLFEACGSTDEKMLTDEEKTSIDKGSKFAFHKMIVLQSLVNTESHYAFKMWPINDAPSKRWREAFGISKKNWFDDGFSVMEKIYDELKIESNLENYIRLSDMLWRMDRDELFNDIDENDNPQVIYTGAPGTGKTYGIRRHIELACLENPIDDSCSIDDIPIWKSERTGKSIKQMEFVQFHSSYDYSDFVEGLRPIQLEEGKDPTFVRMDGVFKRFCRGVVEYNETKNSSDKNFYFIIDEINRADLGKVFGELMYLLEDDYRETPINTQYMALPTYEERIITETTPAPTEDPVSAKIEGDIAVVFEPVETESLEIDETDVEVMPPEEAQTVANEAAPQQAEATKDVLGKPEDGAQKEATVTKTTSRIVKIENGEDCFRDGFYIPKNVHIVGSMNDIDRSVETFDFALRRRFRWIDIKANDVMKDTLWSMFGAKAKARMNIDSFVDSIKKLNGVISDPDNKYRLGVAYHIGPAYFKDYDGTYKSKVIIWNKKVEPILREYVRGRQPNEVEAFVLTCKEKFGLVIPEKLSDKISNLKDKIYLDIEAKKINYMSEKTPEDLEKLFEYGNFQDYVSSSKSKLEIKDKADFENQLQKSNKFNFDMLKEIVNIDDPQKDEYKEYLFDGLWDT